jgi:aryl-alcohol dehydrogenase-like predicted oxidoreductase
VLNDADSVSSVHEALARGINFIDTSAIYDNDPPEVVAGQPLKEWDGDVITQPNYRCPF